MKINKEPYSKNFLDYTIDPRYSKSDFGLGKSNKTLKVKGQRVNKIKKQNKG